MKTIFYSWQSDLPSEINEKFIEESIDGAIKAINEEIQIENSPRNHDLGLDRDTKNIPGSPPIVDTIFKKIDECAIFVADLSFVAKTNPNPKTNKHKPVPNPNVLIEYGYAWKSKGYGKMIGIMNTVFGKPAADTVPFNIRHLDYPIQYELAVDSPVEVMNSVKRSLSNNLVTKFKLILDNQSENVGLLLTELFPSKFYISRRRLIILLKFKVVNSDDKPVTVDLDKINLKLNGDWIEAKRTTISENRIQTDNDGAITFNFDEPILRRDQDIRIDSIDSKVFYMAFELASREFVEFVQQRNAISVQGIITSYDGRTSEFEGEISRYKLGA